MDLEDRIKHQFPAIYITLLSVLIALVFSDLASEAHSRMTLWPLNVGTLRTEARFSRWAQTHWARGSPSRISAFLANGFQSLADSVIVFLVPIPLLFANSLVGQKDIWPWFYYASGYLLVAYASWRWQGPNGQ